MRSDDDGAVIVADEIVAYGVNAHFGKLLLVVRTFSRPSVQPEYEERLGFRSFDDSLAVLEGVALQREILV